MTPEELSEAIAACVAAAVAANQLPASATSAPVLVERPKNREHGDWSTNIAMVLAKPAQRAPRDVAADLVERITKITGVKSADIAGPGFINIFIDPAAAAGLALEIIASDGRYGKSNQLAGQQINVEFISANPTGPLHLGHTRWAAVGDAISRVLIAAGAEVTLEFYINDRGVQMQKFAQSILATIKSESVPEDGYQGEYIAELANQIVEIEPKILQLDAAEQLSKALAWLRPATKTTARLVIGFQY